MGATKDCQMEEADRERAKAVTECRRCEEPLTQDECDQMDGYCSYCFHILRKEEEA